MAPIYRYFPVIVLLMFSCNRDRKMQTINLDKFADGIHHWELFHEVDYPRYQPEEVLSIAENIYHLQNEDGGWPKNIDILAQLNMDSLVNSLDEKDRRSTMDNRNTFPQIEYMAKVYDQTGDPRFKESAWAGISYLLDGQYPNGGWRGWDVDAITYNDEVMTGVMDLFLDIQEGRQWYAWLEDEQRDRVIQALDRAISLTLKCQVIQGGRRTAWAQQHDHETLLPVQGRSYEVPAITASESIPIIRFLMRIDQPDTTIIQAVQASVRWLLESRIYGVRKDSIGVGPGEFPGYTKPYQVVVVEDSTAGPLWARYYDPQSNQPLFCRRDGVRVPTFNEIDVERRWGYEWYGTWPQRLIQEEYPVWCKQWGVEDLTIPSAIQTDRSQV